MVVSYDFDPSPATPAHHPSPASLRSEKLVRFNKDTHTSTNEQALRLLEQFGVAISAGFVVEPDVTVGYFDRLDNYIKNHPPILHAEFTPLTPFPGTRYYEQQKDNVITRDWELYDMQHFVVKTDVPPRDLYQRMVRSYRKVVFSVMWRERLWIPLWGIQNRKHRVLRGLLANGAALKHAHRHVHPELVWPDQPDTLDSEPSQPIDDLEPIAR